MMMMTGQIPPLWKCLSYTVLSLFYVEKPMQVPKENSQCNVNYIDNKCYLSIYLSMLKTCDIMVFPMLRLVTLWYFPC